MIEELFTYTDIDDDYILIYKSLEEHYIMVNGQTVELPIEVVQQIIKILSYKNN